MMSVFIKIVTIMFARRITSIKRKRFTALYFKRVKVSKERYMTQNIL